MNYAGFWKRFWARVVDSLVFAPFILLNFFIVYKSNKDLYNIISLAITILIITYDVLFIYYLGKTPGKMLLKLKVIKDDETSISLENSISRVVFSVVSLCSWIIVQYRIVGGGKYLLAAEKIDYAITIFTIVECLVYYFNYRHKALHDYVARTIVIDESLRN